MACHQSAPLSLGPIVKNIHYGTPQNYVHRKMFLLGDSSAISVHILAKWGHLKQVYADSMLIFISLSSTSPVAVAEQSET
jgi:hypothetical protein